MKVECPYCTKQAELVMAEEVYGDRIRPEISQLKMWLCRPCQAWVGCHKGTDRPLGRLADKNLRKWRMLAHELFDPLWKGRTRKSRRKAYLWLSSRLQIPFEGCHIGDFNVEQCKEVVRICEEGRTRWIG
jgi:hypothetical protein